MSPLPERMSDHWWWRPGVRPGRALLVWHILFDDQPEVRALAREYRKRLDGVPGLDMVPDEWLHMTTQIIGFDDEISQSEQKDMIAAVTARTSGLAPVVLDLGKVLFHAEAVVLGTQPPAALDPLREAIRRAVAETVSVHQLANEPDWTPHISVAYSNASGPARPIIEALTPRPEGCRTTIAQVHLAKQLRDGHVYRWDRLATAHLGGHSA